VPPKARLQRENVQEERLRILEMVEKGQISAREAEQLLEALGDAAGPQRERAAIGGRMMRLRIRITDLKSGRVKTNINVPLGSWGLVSRLARSRWGRRVAGAYIADIQRAAREGARGHIVDVTDENSGERVEILVE
jgi:hypothetical protein